MTPLSQPLLILALFIGAGVLALIRFAASRNAGTKPLGGVAGLLFYYLLGRFIQIYIPPDLWGLIKPYYSTALLLILALAIIRLGVWILFDLILARRKNVEIADIMKDLSSAVLLTLALFIVLRHTLDINLASLIATSAVLSIIIGLALQETLANMFAGLSLQIEKPFAIGDWIAFEDNEGSVQEANWRSTTIKTHTLDIVIIPNSIIAKSVLTNYSRPTRSHICKLTVGVHLHYPPNRVKEAAMNALREDPDIPLDKGAEIRVIAYRDFTILYEIRFPITDYSRHQIIEDKVMTRVWYHLNRSDIPIPFPVRDVNLRSITPDSEAMERLEAEKAISETLMMVEFLSPLSGTERAELASRITLFTAHKDEVVIRQGDPGDSCFIIQSGTAEVSISTPRGKSAVGTLGPGQVFGEMSLMTGDERTATVKAMTDMNVILISKENFSHILAGNPDITEKISSILARRQLELEQKIKETSEALAQEALETRTSYLMTKMRSFFHL